MARSFRLFLALGSVMSAALYARSITTNMQRYLEFLVTIALLESASFMAPVVLVIGNASVEMSNGTSYKNKHLTSPALINIDIDIPSTSATSAALNDQETLKISPADNNNNNPAASSHPNSTNSNVEAAVKEVQEQPSPESSSSSSTKPILLVEFERQEGVVIATKIHGRRSIPQLKQQLCLFYQAYNYRVLYPHVVFTTLPLSSQNIIDLQQQVYPANLTVVVDNPGLPAMLQNMTKQQQLVLLKQCRQTRLANISWKSKCKEDNGSTTDPLSYNWQAEFRALHLWSRPELAEFRYMVWMDSDAFCSKKWERDPVTYMIQEQMVLFFAHFPGGKSHGVDWLPRFQEAFGITPCRIQLDKGHLMARGDQNSSTSCKRAAFYQVHGFFHITDLNFYRSPKVMKWFQILIGDSKFSRRYDDQIGVTAPAAIWAPNRSWEMEYRGLDMDVFHNGRLDGKDWVGKNFALEYWKQNGTTNFPEAVDKCVVDNHG
jgi:hypothetical protein